MPNTAIDEPQIVVIHDEELYVKPLLKELAGRRLPLVEWNLKLKSCYHLFDTTKIPPQGVFYNRISACGCPEHRETTQLARGVLAWLKMHRRKIVNSPEAIPLLASKMEAQIAMRSHGIHVPKSVVAFQDSQIVEAARNLGCSKFLVEPNRRVLGEGVVTFHDLDQLKEYLKSPKRVSSADGITVVQEFVKSNAPYVIRAEFVGRQLLYAMHVDVSRGLDRLVPGYVGDPQHEGEGKEGAQADFTPVPRYQVLQHFEHPILERYVDFMNHFDIDVASFEFTETTDGQVVTFDVDICSTYNAPAEYRAHVPQAGVQAVADHLNRLLELSKPLIGTQIDRKRVSSDSEEDRSVSEEHKHVEVLIADGGVGRELRRRGVPIPQTIWSANALIVAPEEVKKVHLDFIKSGAQIITANNYACTPQFLAKGGVAHRLDELTELACRLAVEARDESGVPGVRVMGSLPPLTESYRADLVGEVDAMEKMYEHLAGMLAKHVDVILCETMSSGKEAYAAAKAALKFDKPVWVSWTLRDDLSKRLRSGETVREAFSMLQDLNVSAFLFNCCVPETIEQALPQLARLTNKPIGAMPNCFAPVPTDWSLSGEHGFVPIREDLRPIDFAGYARGWVDRGATIIGGCCGIGPEHLTTMARDIRKHQNIHEKDGQKPSKRRRRMMEN
mmetsp:Transcript_21515/g.52343  ORF Transcript_21515/g.52343 Transcript_21515/m.52343 type:complete len:672 (-) Transcript_21515:584-2599(-)